MFVFEPGGDGFVLHSLPNKIGAYMQGHFTVDTNLVTGVWLENTAPQGEFQGMIYSGVFHLIIAEDQKRMGGMWVGVGRGDGNPKIYDGRWELAYAGDTAPDL
jgi:hypothetical protein